MTLFASPSLFILAIISFALAYFIGVKQYTWLLSGFNERRVLDKVKLSKIVGLYNLTAGVIATIDSVFSTPNVKILVPIIIIGHVIIAAYVNTRMVHWKKITQMDDLL
ncbi:DUF3784 domain-containing protein [Bacillus cereus]